MKYCYIVTVLLPFFLFSCKDEDSLNKSINNNIDQIDFTENNIKELDFSSFVDTIELIPLETTKESLIGEINRIIYRNNKYYIRTTVGRQNGKILVFDKKGNYSWKLDYLGQGPEEYLSLNDFALSDDNNIVISSPVKLQVYDGSTGNFIRTIKTGELVSKEILYLKDNEILSLHFTPILHENNLLALIDTTGVKEYFFNIGEEYAICSSRSIIERSLLSTAQNYYVSIPYNNTIFRANQDSMVNVKPFCYIDYGSLNISNQIDLKKVKDFDSWLKEQEKLNDYMIISSFGVANSNNYLYIVSVDKSHSGYFTLYSLRTKKHVSSHKLRDDLFLKGNIITVSGKHHPHNMDGNDIIWEMEPEILINGFKQYWSNLSAPRREAFKRDYAEWYRICTSLKEDDNPVLMRIKVKDF